MRGGPGYPRRSRRWPGHRRIPARSTTPGRYSTGLPTPGSFGAGSQAISIPRMMKRHTTTRPATCSPRRSGRRTAPNGSTPACTPYTNSRVRPRATSTSIRNQAKSSRRRAPTNAPSPTPASSSTSKTTSSTRAASWTWWNARPGSSSTVRAPARISRRSAAQWNRCRAEAYRAGSCHSSR